MDGLPESRFGTPINREAPLRHGLNKAEITIEPPYGLREGLLELLIAGTYRGGELASRATLTGAFTPGAADFH